MMNLTHNRTHRFKSNQGLPHQENSMRFAPWITTSSLHRTAAVALAAIVTLTGCGIGPVSGTKSGSTLPGAAMKGRVIGGQQPVVGSSIQLYTAGASGYGSAAVPLLSPAATTDSAGHFAITTPYTCPDGDYVFAVATQGNSGYTNNPNLALMTAVGPCTGLTASTYISINEVTTVASVWALAPFMTGITNIGSPATNVTGLANAFADVNVLVDTDLGTSPGPAMPVGAMVPIAEIYTLANALAACINSGGGTYNDGSDCGMLFAAADPGGTAGTAPIDTVTAAMNIAQHPALHVSAIYGLATPKSPFQTGLTAQPNDFTLAVTFNGSGLSAPSSLAADSMGNVWVPNKSANTVTKLLHNGAPAAGSPFTASLNQPSAIAIDSADSPWITNMGNNTVSRLNSGGSPASGSPLSGGGLNLPNSIAIDNQSNVWVGNGGSPSVTEISGSTLTNYTPAGVTSPVAIAVNPH